MRVAVVDVGANTLRLLVAETDARGGFVPIREERRRTGLGEDIERRGHVTREKIERSGTGSSQTERVLLHVGRNTGKPEVAGGRAAALLGKSQNGLGIERRARDSGNPGPSHEHAKAAADHLHDGIGKARIARIHSANRRFQQTACILNHLRGRGADWSASQGR